MKSSATPDVLRDVPLHAEPRTLARPHAAPAPRVRAVPPAPSIADATVEHRRAGHAEGFALGRAEGLCAGMAAGERDAGARVEAAIREAREEVLAQAAERLAKEQAAFDAVVDRLVRLQQELRSAARLHIESLEGDAMALAFEAVCRIVGEESDCAQRVTGVVQTALRSLQSDSLFRVRMHPDDLQLLRGSAAGQALMSQSGAVEWLGDAGVASGGCMLDTRQGQVDARMETQLTRLRQTWADAARNRENRHVHREGS
jgi:flagellar assembly protein FliH